MGSSISICNATNLILDIALAGPIIMYWQNG